MPLDAINRPLTHDDWQRILGDLSDSQRAIVEADDAALAVVAGPGSGKTRAIIHRIAYLMKVKRVEPEHILTLAYSRNAVRELRVRLRALVGPLAARLRVYTFHGLALALLGRTVGGERQIDQTQVRFDELVPQACQLLEHGDELDDDEDSQARRLRLLGEVEHIFVDEYQDVTADFYRFIKLLSGLNDSSDETRRVHINLCVIGDDDQNIFGYTGASAQYIQNVEQEYGARRLLLVENYRSTPPIIAAANSLIRHNQQRCKRTPEEQVRLADKRAWDIEERKDDLPVRTLHYALDAAQASGLSQLVQHWLRSGVQPGEIAILARHWEELNGIRMALEKFGVPTYALRDQRQMGLFSHLATCQLVAALEADPERVWSADEPVAAWMRGQLAGWGRSLDEPTVGILLSIVEKLDLERGFASPDEDAPLAITANDVQTALFEFNESSRSGFDLTTREGTVVVSSMHSAKGLEFRKVIVLIDGLSSATEAYEEKRRLLYVAMTRAKEDLCVATTQERNPWLAEAQLEPRATSLSPKNLHSTLLFEDLTPQDVNLGHFKTQEQQRLIHTLQEGSPLRLEKYTNAAGRMGWRIASASGTHIGALSDQGCNRLAKKGIHPGQFAFGAGEVTLLAIYHHVSRDEITREVTEDWFVPIPRIRVRR